MGMVLFQAQKPKKAQGCELLETLGDDSESSNVREKF
jgi:hypothetical protein